MIIYGKSIEDILRNNLNLANNEPIIGVGVQVVSKPSNVEKPFFYKTNIRQLYKKDLYEFIGEWHKTEEHFERHIVAVRANVNMAIDEFEQCASQNKLVKVLENDLYVRKLINVDTIEEVSGFVFDPREWKQLNK